MSFMRVSTRRPTIIFFIVFGSCLTAFAIALNVGWILLNLRQVALLVFGIIFFAILIAGLILNTTFLVREIRRNDQQESFLNAVTHELKTPVASIRLYLETLQTRDVDDAKRREFYDVMLADTDRLLGTVEQVLRAGHAGQKRRRLTRQPVDIHALVGECVALARTRYPALETEALRTVNSAGRLAQFDRTTDAKTSASSLIVLGDADDLRAAVSNLIDNAIKYSLERVRVTIEVGATDRQRVMLRVRDEGLGIPAGQLKSIFKRFYRVPLPVMMRVKGTGLGLFIVRHIVERHGGRVYAESAGENQGSAFTILLPLAEVETTVKSLETKTA